MSKANRGKGTFERYNRGKGTCPVCGRTNIKATYEVEVGEKKFSVCKQCKACKAGIAHGKLKDKIAAL